MNTFAIARSSFFALLTCLCLLGFSGETWAQPTSAATSLVDTRSVHFVNYWLRANDALITPRARRHMAAGTVRPSFSSTLRPIRYQLIDAADRDKIVSPLDLLCLSRAHGSLILMCPASATSPKRSVPITGSICRHRRTLPAILPEGCMHPYVVTLEGRTVEVRYATLVAAHRLAPDRGSMASVDTPSVQTNVAPPPSVSPSDLSTTIELARAQRTNQLERHNQRLHEQNRELQARQNSGATSIIIMLLCLVFFLIVRERRSSRILPSQSVPKPTDQPIPRSTDSHGEKFSRLRRRMPTTAARTGWTDPSE